MRTVCIYKNYPPTLSSTIAGCIPKKGLVGNPGFGVELSGAGRGVIITPPVSVHQK